MISRPRPIPNRITPPRRSPSTPCRSRAPRPLPSTTIRRRSPKILNHRDDSLLSRMISRILDIFNSSGTTVDITHAAKVQRVLVLQLVM